MFELRVNKVQQRSSGGDHVTKYDAEVVLTEEGIQVEIIRVEPAVASLPDVIESAREAIRAGAEKVLGPRGKGARIRVTRLVINLVDFKPKMFERYTAEELTTVLERGTET